MSDGSPADGLAFGHFDFAQNSHFKTHPCQKKIMSEDYWPKQAAIQTETVETFVFKADHVHCVDHYGAFHWSDQDKKTSIHSDW